MRTLTEIMQDELQASHPILLDSAFDDMEPVELQAYDIEDEESSNYVVRELAA